MFYILIGYNVRNLYQSIRIEVEVMEIIYMHGIRLFCLKAQKIFSGLMLLYYRGMKCCDKLMAFLLFYGVIKFLLITPRH